MLQVELREARHAGHVRRQVPQLVLLQVQRLEVDQPRDLVRHLLEVVAGEVEVREVRHELHLHGEGLDAQVGQVQRPLDPRLEEAAEEGDDGLRALGHDLDRGRSREVVGEVQVGEARQAAECEGQDGELVAVEDEGLEVGQLAHGARQRLQAVHAEVERAQRHEVAQCVGELGDAVVVQVECRDAREEVDAVGHHADLVVRQIHLLELGVGRGVAGKGEQPKVHHRQPQVRPRPEEGAEEAQNAR
mmetsp:Transcript_80655/g.216145  ORF Transcript_80655/g.216145 Transcript_80655/m.216145 type:complete len:246 (-) Transcript_80655:5772-6509(-)